MSAWSTSGVSLAEKLKQQKAASIPSKEDERQQETSPAAAVEAVEANRKEDGPRRAMKKSEKTTADAPVAAAASQELEKQPAVAPPVSVSGPVDESDEASNASTLPVVALPAEVAALVSDEFSFVGVYTKPEAPVALTTTEVAPVAPAPLKNELPVVASRAAASSAAPVQPPARYPTHHHHHQHHHHSAAGAPIHTNSYNYPPYGMMPSYNPRPYSGYPNQYAGYPVYPEHQYYGNQMGYGYGRGGGQFNPSGLFSTARGGYRGNNMYRGAPVVHQYDSYPPQYNYDQAQSEPL